MKVESLLDKGKHFCIIPWINLHVTAKGFMSPCMYVTEGPASIGFGSLNEHTFKELWQGEEIRCMRLKMLKDEFDSRCLKCYEREKLGYYSFRKDSAEKYKHLIDFVINTDEEGFAPDAKPVIWDIRFSNVCNLKCRTCNYHASSSWYSDEKALGLIKPETGDEIIKGIQDTDEFLNEITKFFPYIEYVHFAGGEPLLMKENQYILEKLDALKKYDTKIVYNTNFTILNSNYLNATKIWKKLKNLTIFISLDAAGLKGEYIRKGLKWEEILENRKKILEDCPSAKIIVNTTISIYNILDLPDFHKHLVESGFSTADEMRLNLLHVPRFLNMKILPPALKKIATEKLVKHREWLKQQPPFENVNDPYYKAVLKQWHVCIDYLNSEDRTNLIPEFIDHTAALDALRNESLLDIFPELTPLYFYKPENRSCIYRNTSGTQHI